MRYVLLTLLALAFATGSTFASEKTFGKRPTVRKETAISTIQAKPDKFRNKTVLLAGKVVDICRHAGCWVEIEQANGSKILCKSLGDVVTFPQHVLGHQIRLQGKVMYDAMAPGFVEEKHEGGESHACPAPQVMVSIDGATVLDLAEADPDSAPDGQKE